jgi:hypothetical protein
MKQQPKVDPFLAQAKGEQKQKIAKAIELKIGRPPVSAVESRKRAAITDMLAGEPIADVERKYALAQNEMMRFMKQTFPTDEDRFEFMENCLLTNATLAGAKFVATYNEMNAEQAARAMSLFTNTALAVKKARESGFKEAPISVGVILSLQETLAKLTPAPTQDV